MVTVTPQLAVTPLPPPLENCIDLSNQTIMADLICYIIDPIVDSVKNTLIDSLDGQVARLELAAGVALTGGAVLIKTMQDHHARQARRVHLQNANTNKNTNPNNSNKHKQDNDDNKQQADNKEAHKKMRRMVWCHTMITALSNRLTRIEKRLDRLLIEQLKTSLVYLKQAQRAFKTNNFDNFKQYIQKSSDSAIRATNMVRDLSNRLQAYCIRIFTDFLIFSHWGEKIGDGIVQMYEVLEDMLNDKELNIDIGKILTSKVYWTKRQKQNYVMLCAFCIKVEELITHFVQSSKISVNYSVQGGISSGSGSSGDDNKESKENKENENFVNININSINNGNLKNGGNMINAPALYVFGMLFGDKYDKNYDLLKNRPNILETRFFGHNKQFIDSKGNKASYDSIMKSTFDMFGCNCNHTNYFEFVKTTWQGINAIHSRSRAHDQLSQQQQGTIGQQQLQVKMVEYQPNMLLEHIMRTNKIISSYDVTNNGENWIDIEIEYKQIAFNARHRAVSKGTFLKDEGKAKDIDRVYVTPFDTLFTMIRKLKKSQNVFKLIPNTLQSLQILNATGMEHRAQTEILLIDFNKKGYEKLLEKTLWDYNIANRSKLKFIKQTVALYV